MSDMPYPEEDRAPEPPYAKAPRHRVLPDFTAPKLKRELEEGDVETSQSSEESTQPITKEVLKELQYKLMGYVEREDPSTAKNGPKYDHLDVTPTSSQASGSQVNYGSQESANGLANLEEDLIPYFTETLGWKVIRERLRDCVCVKPGPFKSEDEKLEAMDELHTKLNENVLAILKLVEACLETFEKPSDTEAAEEPCDTEEGEVPQPTIQKEARPGKRVSFSEEVDYFPRKRTRSSTDSTTLLPGL